MAGAAVACRAAGAAVAGRLRRGTRPMGIPVPLSPAIDADVACSMQQSQTRVAVIAAIHSNCADMLPELHASGMPCRMHPLFQHAGQAAACLWTASRLWSPRAQLEAAGVSQVEPLAGFQRSERSCHRGPALHLPHHRPPAGTCDARSWGRRIRLACLCMAVAAPPAGCSL